MKFVMVIANEEYQSQMEEVYMELECSATKIASTGDFLQYGETIFLLGLQEQQEEQLCRRCRELFHEEGKSGDRHIRMFTMDIDQFVKCGGGIAGDDREESTGSMVSASESGEAVDGGF